MKLKALFADDDAVSPVIGVILMVAITVILAAVIGAFVLDLGSNQESAPQASFDYDFGSSTVDITHDGGDDLDSDTMKVTSGGNTNDTLGNGAQRTISAGDPVVTGFSTSGDEVKIIWSSSSGGESSVISSQEVPS